MTAELRLSIVITYGWEAFFISTGDKRRGKQVIFERRTRASDKQVKPLEELFTAFYNAKVAEGKSERTLETYEECFRYLCEYMDDNEIRKELGQVTVEMLREYVSFLLNKRRKWDGHKHKSEECMTVGLSPVTVNTRMKGLRVMFRFLKEERIINENPFDHVKPIEEPESDIFIMNVEQLRKLLKAPDQRTYAGFRDYVAMNVLIDSFCRIGEVINLKETEVDFYSNTLVLSAKRTKSRKSRIVPIQKRTADLIKELMKESEEFESEYIFLTNYGGVITDDQFRNRLKMHAQVAGIDIRVYPHLFRHTSATLFLENGGDIRHLQKILGHADLRMCERYTHLSTKSVKNQHEQYSPMNNVITKLNKSRKIKR